jgi:hypothetical protein
MHLHIIDKQIKEAILAGEMRDITTQHLLLLIGASFNFLFQNKALTIQLWDFSESDFDAFWNEHKATVKKMLLTYLFPGKDTGQNFLPRF